MSLWERILLEHVLSYLATGGARILFQKGLIFLERNKTGFFCFNHVTKTNQDQIVFRIQVIVAEWLSLQIFVLI